MSEDTGSCGTIAMSTGNALLTVGVPLSTKCTLTTLVFLADETAATISGGSWLTGFAGAAVDVVALGASGVPSPQPASAIPAALATTQRVRLERILNLRRG